MIPRRLTCVSCGAERRPPGSMLWIIPTNPLAGRFAVCRPTYSPNGQCHQMAGTIDQARILLVDADAARLYDRYAAQAARHAPSPPGENADQPAGGSIHA